MQRISPSWRFTPCFTDADQVGVTPTRQEPPLSPMSLLASGIPLSLLLDLFCGPESADLMSQERLSEE